MDPISLIGAGSALGGGILNLFSQGQQQQQQQGALQMAMQNYLLNKRIADQQYELATAGQEDARGNKTRYVPGQGWVTDTTPETASLIKQSDAIARNRGTDDLTRGQDERSRNYNRRMTEGSAASPLLAQMQYGYGAPTREGVVGANKIAGVTSVAENADNVKSGYASAALRTGTGTNNLGPTLASADRGATAGIRTALARGDAEGGPLYDEMLAKFNGSKLDPYNMLATRASNAEGSSFQPENISGGLDSTMLQRAGVGANVAGRGAAGINSSMSPLLAMMSTQRGPNYDTFAAGLGKQLQSLFPAKKEGIVDYTGGSGTTW
jgi:hypothetical protein